MFTKLQLNQLKSFFSYKRPHKSESERQWMNEFLFDSLDLMGCSYIEDDAGNIHVDRRGGASKTLFIAHVDSVHREAGRQETVIDKNYVLKLADSTKSNCLGADDAAGVLVLLTLIKSGVSGYYIFSRGEECGGIGAKFLVDHFSDLLSTFNRAIAFDRRGTSSVITHQGWGRCCSDAFADALSDALSDEFLMYAPDDTGVYTDTAEFVDIIPECTNISVGYMNEHSTSETLDLNHLYHLINRVAQIDWEALPTERDPLDEQYVDKFGAVGLRDYGFTEFNSVVYDALIDAQSGDFDGLLWLIAEAVSPVDPDEVYAMLWSATLPPDLIKRAIKQVDRATSDGETQEALFDLYDALYSYVPTQYH